MSECECAEQAEWCVCAKKPIKFYVRTVWGKLLFSHSSSTYVGLKLRVCLLADGYT